MLLLYNYYDGHSILNIEIVVHMQGIDKRDIKLITAREFKSMHHKIMVHQVNIITAML